MRKYTALLPVVAAYAASAVTFSQLPASTKLDFSPVVPFNGASDESMPSIVAALMLPTVALLVYLFLNRLAGVKGPARKVPDWWLNESTGAAGVKRFEPTFNSVIFAVTSLLALIHLVMLGAALRWPQSFFQLIFAILGLGFIAIGNVMPRVRPNWIVGLRSKRILSNPHLWAKAHRALGMLLMIAGAITVIASIIAPRWALLIALSSLLIALAAAGMTPEDRAASHV